MNKNIFLCFFLITMTSQVYADSHHLPQSWIAPDREEEKSLSEIELAPSAGASEHYLKMLDFDQRLVESALDKPADGESKSGHWYLQSIETKLALEPVGTIGPIGVKGEAVVKLHWNRTAASLAALRGQQTKNRQEQQEEQQEETDDSLQLNGDESLHDIEVKLLALGRSLEKNGRITSQHHFVQNVLPLVKQYTHVATAINHAHDHANWIPYRFQLDIYVEAEGNINPLVSVGGGTRIRLEWNRYKKLMPKSGVMLKPVDLANSQMIEAMAQDFGQLAALNSSTSDFSLDNIKVGIGVGIRGNIFVTKGKAGVRASLIYKRAVHNKSLSPDIVNKQNSQFIQVGIDHKEDQSEVKYLMLERDKFKAQMVKVLAMANFFTRHASRVNRPDANKKFELGIIELELQMSARGSIGLVTVEGMNVFELVLNKRR